MSWGLIFHSLTFHASFYAWPKFPCNIQWTVLIYILLFQVFFSCIIINHFRPTLHMFSCCYHVPLQYTPNYHLTQLQVFSSQSFNVNQYIHPLSSHLHISASSLPAVDILPIIWWTEPNMLFQAQWYWIYRGAIVSFWNIMVLSTTLSGY